MKTILVPLDFSSVSRRVLQEARRLARLLPARIALIHIVKQPPILDNYPGALIDTTPIIVSLERAARAHLTKWRHQLQKAGFSTTQQIYVGIPGYEIVQEAKTLRPEYIVIGSPGHNAYYNFAVGSTTGAVIKSAPCPVVVVASPPAATVRKRR